MRHLKMRWMGHAARFGEMRNAYKILVGKPERKRRLWGDLGVDERTGRNGSCEGVDWVHLS
jgi:hypothetical protein